MASLGHNELKTFDTPGLAMKIKKEKKKHLTMS